MRGHVPRAHHGKSAQWLAWLAVARLARTSRRVRRSTVACHHGNACHESILWRGASRGTPRVAPSNHASCVARAVVGSLLLLARVWELALVLGLVAVALLAAVGERRIGGVGVAALAALAPVEALARWPRLACRASCEQGMVRHRDAIAIAVRAQLRGGRMRAGFERA